MTSVTHMAARCGGCRFETRAGYCPRRLGRAGEGVARRSGGWECRRFHVSVRCIFEIHMFRVYLHYNSWLAAIQTPVCVKYKFVPCMYAQVYICIYKCDLNTCIWIFFDVFLIHLSIYILHIHPCMCKCMCVQIPK